MTQIHGQQKTKNHSTGYFEKITSIILPLECHEKRDKALNFVLSHGPCGKSQVSVCITKNLFRFQSTSKKYYRRLPELAPKRSFISDNSQKFDSNDPQLILETKKQDFQQ